MIKQYEVTTLPSAFKDTSFLCYDNVASTKLTNLALNAHHRESYNTEANAKQLSVADKGGYHHGSHVERRMAYEIILVTFDESIAGFLVAPNHIVEKPCRYAVKPMPQKTVESHAAVGRIVKYTVEHQEIVGDVFVAQPPVCC